MKNAIEFLYQLPYYTEKNPMEHTREFLHRLGDPQEAFRVIHIAGSNGKGSTASFLFHILKASGIRAGLFTSPHLTDIRERFVTDGGMCTEEEFLAAYGAVRRVMEDMKKDGLSLPTFFESIFAIGMLIFRKKEVRWVVLEAGMGGLSDTTNVVRHPAVSVITSISLEHTEYLGETIREIAGQKAGIIREGVPVVYDGSNPEAAAVIRKTAEEKGAPAAESDPAAIHILRLSGEGIDFSIDGIDFFDSDAYDKENVWHIPFAAEYQTRNAALAILAWKALLDHGFFPEAENPGELSGGSEGMPPLRPDREAQRRAVYEGLSHTAWPGRMQEILPGVYFDGAHNTGGISVFIKSVRRMSADDACPPILLFSMVREKDIQGCIALLTREMEWDRIAVSTVPGERGVDPELPAQEFRKHVSCPVSCLKKPDEAFWACYSGKKDGQKLFCTGSLYFIGELIRAVRQEKPYS